jgi:hypothetical protein
VAPQERQVASKGVLVTRPPSVCIYAAVGIKVVTISPALIKVKFWTGDPQPKILIRRDRTLSSLHHFPHRFLEGRRPKSRNRNFPLSQDEVSFCEHWSATSPVQTDQRTPAVQLLGLRYGPTKLPGAPMIRMTTCAMLARSTLMLQPQESIWGLRRTSETPSESDFMNSGP